MRVEERYADVLQNIESAIVTVFDSTPKLVDRDVLAAVTSLIKGYAREKAGRAVQSPGPSGRARIVYEQCRRICEWRLGRAPLNEGEPREDDPRPGELSVPEILLCLKRLRKSLRLWHARGGPRGYLEYVQQFLDDLDACLEELHLGQDVVEVLTRLEGHPPPLPECAVR